MLKTCSRCRVPKSPTEFRPCKRAKDGRRQPCLPCAKAAEKTIRANQADRIRDNHARWRRENPDAVRAHAQKFRLSNPEKYRAIHTKYRQENPETYRQSSRRYYLNNREKVLEKTRNRAPSLNAYYSRMYQMRRSRAAPSWLTIEHKKQIRKFYDVARWATQETGISHHVDHIVPIRGKTVCGLHVPWNLQVLSGVENSEKSNRL